MKLKLDENVPLGLVARLHALGHDVHSVFDERLEGASDADLWSACVREERMLITQDLDFSDTRRFSGPNSPGVLIARLDDDSRAHLLDQITLAFRDYDPDAWIGCVVVLSDRKLRIRGQRK